MIRVRARIRIKSQLSEKSKVDILFVVTTIIATSIRVVHMRMQVGLIDTTETALLWLAVLPVFIEAGRQETIRAIAGAVGREA